MDGDSFWRRLIDQATKSLLNIYRKNSKMGLVETSMTRCWHKKNPKFLQNLPKNQPKQFQVKSDAFKNGPNWLHTNGLLLLDNLSTFKNRPNWSHWFRRRKKLTNPIRISRIRMIKKTSATRICAISPQWLILKVLGQIFGGLFSIWQIIILFRPIFCCWAIFYFSCKCPNI